MKVLIATLIIFAFSYANAQSNSNLLKEGVYKCTNASRPNTQFVFDPSSGHLLFNDGSNVIDFPQTDATHFSITATGKPFTGELVVKCKPARSNKTPCAFLYGAGTYDATTGLFLLREGDIVQTSTVIGITSYLSLDIVTSVSAARNGVVVFKDSVREDEHFVFAVE